MNLRQVMGIAGGFLLVYVVITLTNRPTISPRSPQGELPPTGSEAPQGGANALAADFMKGITLSKGAIPAWEGPRFQAALLAAKAMGATWVAYSPTLSQATGHSEGPELPSPEAKADLSAAIQAAHAQGLKVFVRPVVVCQDGTQRGFLEPRDADGWFAQYRKAFRPLAEAAANDNAELLALGVGLTRLGGAPWDRLAQELRRSYHGYLTHEVAWAELSSFPHWAAFDYAGAQVDLSRQEALSGPPSGVAGKPVLFTSVAGPGGQGLESFFAQAKAPWVLGSFVAALEVEADSARPNPFALRRAAKESLASQYGGQAPTEAVAPPVDPSEAPTGGATEGEGKPSPGGDGAPAGAASPPASALEAPSLEASPPGEEAR